MKLKIALAFIIATINLHALAQVDRISYLLDSANKAEPFYGNVLIIKHGKTLLEKSYGYVDSNQNPLTVNHSFQVASISKQFTAYAIMLLKSKGLLSYDDDVKKHLKNFPYSNITIRHLLNHTSGLPDFWERIRPNLDTLKSNGNKEALKYLIEHNLPLQFEPGTRIEYCDIGYDFLANIIELVSGLGYDEYLSRNMFKPLKMSQTFAYKVTDVGRIKNKNLAVGHVYKNNKFEYAHLQPNNNFVFYLGDFYGDGSVVTSARDFAIWSNALNTCALLPCKIQQEAFNPVQSKDSTLFMWDNVGYGFGWMLKPADSSKLVFHTGFHPGNVHAIYRFIDKDITFIFLSNAETPDIRKLRNRILEVLERE